MFFLEPRSYPANPNSLVASDYQMQVHEEIFFEYDYSNGYISTEFSTFQFECIDYLYDFIDSSHVINCLDVWPNGVLQNQSFSSDIADINSKASSISTGTGTVTYTIENAGTFNKNSKVYFEFDIYLSTSNNSTFYDIGRVDLEYNDDAFGSNIVANNKVTIQRGAIVSNTSTYDVFSVGDLQNDRISILAGSVNSTTINRHPISSTPQQLVHVKIEISDCSKLPGISFKSQNTNMLNTSTYSTSATGNGPSYWFAYSSIVANDTENGQLCLMNINSISPTTVCLTSTKCFLW